MKCAVIGAGAIGGYLGARLALAGEDVTFIARGANLAAIGQGGFKLIEADGTERIATSARAISVTPPWKREVTITLAELPMAMMADRHRRAHRPRKDVNGKPWLQRVTRAKIQPRRTARPATPRYPKLA